VCYINPHFTYLILTEEKIREDVQSENTGDLEQSERDAIVIEDDFAASVVMVSFSVDKLDKTLSIHSERRLHVVVHLHNYHCLHHLLPVAKSTKYALRAVGHGLSLEHVLSELHKKTFINRMIFTDC